MKYKIVSHTKAFVELFWKIKDWKYLALYRVFVATIIFLTICIIKKAPVGFIIATIFVSIAAFMFPAIIIIDRCKIAAIRLGEKYKMDNGICEISLYPDYMEVSDADTINYKAEYQSITNYYKLKHYYFFLIVTDEVIPVFIERNILTHEQQEELEAIVWEKAAQQKEQSVKTIKEKFAFYKISPEGDMYGV